MSEEKVGVAFAGAGVVAEMHGRGVSINPQAKLIGVYDPQTAKAKAITKKFGGRVFRSLDEILSDKQVEAVHVLTPPEHHVSTAVASLKAGKHVLLEKPITRTIAEIRRLQAAARKANRVVVRHPDGDVVAILEVVSPGNKDSRHAVRAFSRKANRGHREHRKGGDCRPGCPREMAQGAAGEQICDRRVLETQRERSIRHSALGAA